jgi:Uma2 family endonuclease
VEPARSRVKLTYADFEQFPDDLLRHEIIDGQHCVTPAPSTRHQRVSRRLLMVLGTYLEQRPFGEVFCAPFDVLLSHHDVVEPDLIYVSNERLPLLTAKNLQGPPDLVIEILSPGTKQRDLTLKRDLYRRVGVREYWLVDPDANRVTVHRWPGEGDARVAEFGERDVLETRLLPGQQLAVAALLA